MSDPRTTPDPELAGEARPAQVSVPVCDLLRRPDGPRDRQLLYGEQVTSLHAENGWAYVQAAKDGYCGHLRMMGLSDVQQATHRVSAPATHAYLHADFKSSDRASLSYGSLVHVAREAEGYAETPLGYIPRQHLKKLEETAKDPVAVAELFLGTPYLWGGNSRWGIDCSGLVQTALLACGIDCPGDSDMQEKAVGQSCDDNTPPQRNDLLFWKGHVALVTGQEEIIHANAYAMSVTREGLSEAIARIEEQGGGPVTAHRRPVLPASG